MKNIIANITLVIVALFAVSALAADKVVVIPLNSSSPGPHYYTLPGAVFVGKGTSTHLSDNDGTISSLGVGNYHFAPVILPNGATLTEFAVWAQNTMTSGPDDDVSLMRYDRLAAAPFAMASANIPVETGTFTKFVAPSITPDVIDNIDYSYAVVLHSNSGLLKVSAVRITYTSK